MLSNQVVIMEVNNKEELVRVIPTMERSMFDDRTIDLIRSFDAYTKDSKPPKLWKDNFGGFIVDLALGVVKGYNSKENIIGIRLCLKHLVSQIQRKPSIWKVSHKAELIGESIKNNQHVDLLVESLIYSIIEFREDLDEHHSGLADSTRVKLNFGFELMCLWASSGALSNPENKDLIVLRENSKFKKFIYDGASIAVL